MKNLYPFLQRSGEFYEIKQIGKDLLDSKNLIVELKNRINSLNLRIEGKKTYNSSGKLIREGNDQE